MKSFHERPGAELLIRFRQHGTGLDLLRAYLERRRADEAADARWRAAHARKLAKGMPSDEADAAFERQIRLNILSALDPLIEDLVRVGDQPGDGAAQLTRLRQALRFEPGVAPGVAANGSSALADTEVQPLSDTPAPPVAKPPGPQAKWSVIALWLTAYGRMAGKRGADPYRSEQELKALIAAESGVNPITVLRYWRTFCKAEPTQEAWANGIAEAAKARDAKA